jgi:hypothetical protein
MIQKSKALVPQYPHHHPALEKRVEMGLEREMEWMLLREAFERVLWREVFDWLVQTSSCRVHHHRSMPNICLLLNGVS